LESLKSGVEGIMKMWDFVVKFSQNKTKGSQGKKMTYNAVSIRVKQYKQKLAEIRVGVKHNNLKLMERPESWDELALIL
jgi:hypothetical protein